MHKAIFLEGILEFTIEPDGPILIKTGETGGADPTHPDMEFVRTSAGAAQDGIYLPGPSLKGVVRAQAERICRSLDRERKGPENNDPPLADNPMGKEAKYVGLNDMQHSSGRYIESIRREIEDKPERTAIIYSRSSFVSQLFGHTSLAGRVRFADAYGEGIKTEERNGVAIDRVYGSVAVGPFNYETVVAGKFPTSIYMKNVTLAHLALLGLSLRDLSEGRVAIGFGKSRGLGRVKVTFNSLTLHYPMCVLGDDGGLWLLNKRRINDATKLVGVGAFEQQSSYGFPKDDTADLPQKPPMRYEVDSDWGIGVKLHAPSEEAVRSIWKACMPSWKRVIGWQS